MPAFSTWSVACGVNLRSGELGSAAAARVVEAVGTAYAEGLNRALALLQKLGRVRREKEQGTGRDLADDFWLSQEMALLILARWK